MNLLAWVVALLAFGVLKFMVYSEYTNTANQPAELTMPDFPSLNSVTTNTYEFHTVPPCNLITLCINVLAEYIYNLAVIIINVFIVAFNIVKWIIALVVFIYDFILFAINLLFFNSFGDATPWYVKVLINTPVIFALAMILIKIVVSFFGGSSGDA